uniref:Uncharacterized protein n=1 Tax=Timema douglasi TaxID=61478 RepID=A0A7R8ZBJ5_TIMDO|nr:unnamed protein product [Timema douglasi]
MYSPRYLTNVCSTEACEQFTVPQSSAAGQGRQMPTPQPTSGMYLTVQWQQCSSYTLSKKEGPTAPYIPPSEQQVLEPKKYTGGAIPSRSFRMLQAMTASPEDCGESWFTLVQISVRSNLGYKNGNEYDIGRGARLMTSPTNLQSELVGRCSICLATQFIECRHLPVLGPGMCATSAQWAALFVAQEAHHILCCPASHATMATAPGKQLRPTWPQASIFINAQDPNLPNSRVGYDEYPPYWCGYYPQQAMDPYSAMYAYMAEMNAAYGYPPIPYPPMYYPHPFARYPHGSDSDDYSSTDEMAYYGANFARNAAAVHQPNIIVTPSVASKSEDDETTSDSDTEVEEEDSSGRDLKAIRSVSDISIYKSGSEGLLHSSDVNDEESEREEDTDEEEEEEPSENLPHQLSVIFEESEHSDFGTRHDEDSSTATLDESDADLELPESPSSTVTVCLPLKLKFSRSENDEEVTTVIVGDSQVKHSESGNASDENIPILKENIKCTGHHKPDVSVTISFPSKTNSGNIKDVGKLSPVTCESANVDHIMHQVSASDLDCYETAESDSDVSVSLSLPLHQRQHKASISTASPSNDDDKLKTDNSDSPVSHWEDDSSSTVSIQTVKLDSEVHGHSSSSDADTVISVETKSPALTTVEDDDESSEESEEEEEEEEEDDDDDDDDEASEDEENSSSSSSAHSFVSNKEPIKQNIGTKEDHTESIVQKIYDICTKLDDDKEGGKRLGEESEEDDSGVTSDMSRQISDADTESDDLIKLTRYQRASTHSRLFKLLQDECEKSDDEDDSKEERDKPRSREQLTLPLQTHSDLDSLSSSSGVASPSSPTITDRLVKELVHSLLQRKKGKRLKKLPLAKLHAAALRILQEDMDPYDTGSSATSEETSPIRNSVAPASQVNIPYGANYYDYCDYYNSWANAASYYGADPSVEYDIVPSRAFKLLQEHAQPEGFSSGVINAVAVSNVEHILFLCLAPAHLPLHSAINVEHILFLCLAPARLPLHSAINVEHILFLCLAPARLPLHSAINVEHILFLCLAPARLPLHSAINVEHILFLCLAPARLPLHSAINVEHILFLCLAPARLPLHSAINVEHILFLCLAPARLPLHSAINVEHILFLCLAPARLPLHSAINVEHILFLCLAPARLPLHSAINVEHILFLCLAPARLPLHSAINVEHILFLCLAPARLPLHSAINVEHILFLCLAPARLPLHSAINVEHILFLCLAPARLPLHSAINVEHILFLCLAPARLPLHSAINVEHILFLCLAPARLPLHSAINVEHILFLCLAPAHLPLHSAINMEHILFLCLAPSRLPLHSAINVEHILFLCLAPARLPLHSAINALCVHVFHCVSQRQSLCLTDDLTHPSQTLSYILG